MALPETMNLPIGMCFEPNPCVYVLWYRSQSHSGLRVHTVLGLSPYRQIVNCKMQVTLLELCRIPCEDIV